MPTIQKRKTKCGKTKYRAMIRIQGFPSKTATFSSKPEAIQWAQTQESTMRKNHLQTCDTSITFQEAIIRYKATVLNNNWDRNKWRHLKWWGQFMGNLKLIEITPKVISECRNQLIEEVACKGASRSPSTINRYVTSLSHLFSVACKDWHLLISNPVSQIRKLKEPRGRVRFLDDKERFALLESCAKSRNPTLYPIVVLGLSTGMRKAEILQLKWKDIDFNRNRIVLENTKNGERRGVPLVGLALAVLQKQSLEAIQSSYVFRSPDDLTKPCSIRTAWEFAIERAGVEDFRFHDLRHSTASYLAMNGASLLEIAEILGHKTLQMVKRYSHLSESHTTKVLERMNENIFLHQFPTV
jgi:integrase